VWVNRGVFRGNVDNVSRAGVSGWAATEESSDTVVEVSIFLGGGKIAQIPCAAPRADLKQLGTFGNGAHGFRFDFATPLGTDADKRVTVRFSDSGKLLAGGDVLLRRDNTTVVRDHKGNRLIGEPEPIPAPRGARGLFEIFALLDDKTDLFDLLSRFDFAGVKPNDIQSMVFDDLPATKSTQDAVSAGYSAQNDLHNLLLSDEFQSNLITLFLRAFPEKKRLIFVHVPKCAGTDLSANLMSRYPFLHEQMLQPHWIGKDDLFQAISRLVLNLRFFDQLFVTGHNSLRYYGSRGLIRPSDKVFTILRDPVEIAISQVNYVMTRFAADARTGNFAPDTREWMTALDIGTLPSSIPPAMEQRLCGQILRCDSIVRPNSMCFWLGGDDAETALGQLVAHNVEMTVMENYATWLSKVWGITTRTRLNRSETFITTEMLSDQELSGVREAYSEDVKLYATISQALQQSGKLSVTGDDLQKPRQ
jgi:hypothetical protein